jgi:hypothetical protein
VFYAGTATPDDGEVYASPSTHLTILLIKILKMHAITRKLMLINLQM